MFLFESRVTFEPQSAGSGFNLYPKTSLVSMRPVSLYSYIFIKNQPVSLYSRLIFDQ